MKCAYSRCFCEDKSLDDKDVIKINKSRFHAECYAVREDINQIKLLFHDYVNENVVWSQLNGVINNIIFNKGCTSPYLLFGLKYYIEKKIPLNYPAGLYYVIQNKDVKKEWDRLQIPKQNSIAVVSDEESNSQFGYKIKKSKGFGDILCH